MVKGLRLMGVNSNMQLMATGRFVIFAVMMHDFRDCISALKTRYEV